MEKPTFKSLKYLDFNECCEWVGNKLGKDLTNYAGKTYDQADNDIPYYNFWHWILDNNEIHNGCFFWLSLVGSDDDPEWVKEILRTFGEEFKDYIDGNDIKFWVEW